MDGTWKATDAGHPATELLTDPMWEPVLYGTPMSRMAVRIALLEGTRQLGQQGLASAGFDEAIRCLGALASLPRAVAA